MIDFNIKYNSNKSRYLQLKSVNMEQNGGYKNFYFESGTFDELNQNTNNLYEEYISLFGDYFKNNISLSNLKAGVLNLGYDGKKLICVATFAGEEKDYIIYNVFVHPDYRGRGVCHWLMKNVIKTIRNKKFS